MIHKESVSPFFNNSIGLVGWLKIAEHYIWKKKNESWSGRLAGVLTDAISVIIKCCIWTPAS